MNAREQEMEDMEGEAEEERARAGWITLRVGREGECRKWRDSMSQTSTWLH